MFKKILIILILFSLNNCGYSPIYSKSNKINFTVGKLKFEGDRQINNYLKSKLMGYSSTNDEILYDFNITNTYTKVAHSKDATGAVTVYQLQLNTLIKVNGKDEVVTEGVVKTDEFTKEYNFSEGFLMKNDNDKFQESSYENTIKENMINAIFDKFILEMMNR